MLGGCKRWPIHGLLDRILLGDFFCHHRNQNSGNHPRTQLNISPVEATWDNTKLIQPSESNLSEQRLDIQLGRRLALVQSPSFHGSGGSVD